MSLFKKIGRAIGTVARAVAPVAGFIPGVGQAVAAASLLGASHAARAGAAPGPLIMSGPSRLPSLSSLTSSVAPIGGMVMSAAIPGGLGMALPQIGRAAGAIGGMIGRGASTIARSANVYCRRHPAWCASIGGLPGVVGLLESGQLPTIRRRRGRGITPRDLRSFKRVANLIRGFCPTVRRIPARSTRHVRGTGISHA